MSATCGCAQKKSLDFIPLKRALISVYDKTGLLELAKELAAAGVEIVSTGSTAKKIADAGIAVTPVEKVTNFPECLDGRVKTLHPHIHAGILADRSLDSHIQQLEQLGVKPFDLVVCNLYPFASTVKSGADFAGCIEQIDIGGPSMVRAAAKNHLSVAVITDPSQYSVIADALKAGGTTYEQRRGLAAAAFAHTAAYDAQVATWFAQQLALTDSCTGAEATDQSSDITKFPAQLQLPVSGEYRLAHSLRYGENPHQAGAVYFDSTSECGIAKARQLQGKEMSFNNYVDADAALRAAYDQSGHCVAIIKHANPCGIAVADSIEEAYLKANACDPLSAYGGVIAATSPVTKAMAELVKPVFTEVIVAPAYEPEALKILATKKNLRVLIASPLPSGQLEYKPISGGLLVHQRDELTAQGDDFTSWKLVSGPEADEKTRADLLFAWRAVRAVRSNAILLASDLATVGVGMGQVNRVDSCKLAVERANTLGSSLRAPGSVAASDAFFPFADGLQVLLDAGVKAVVQPGGSIRDEEVIAAAQQAQITMYLTGDRHFFH